MVVFRMKIVVTVMIGNYFVIANIIPNTTDNNLSLREDISDTKNWEFDLNKVETRRQMKDKANKEKKIKKSRSTSSSSGEKYGSGESEQSSLEMSDDSGSSDSKGRKKYSPKSSLERTGWRKWHRKCTGCPGDMKKKWRDPSISWICGAYQRARRSFKSVCMMHYRNCQDGTMFTKIHNNKCRNETKGNAYHGEHFFYDYKVVMSMDSTNSDDSSEDTSFHSSSDSDE